jgi:putative transposase
MRKRRELIERAFYHVTSRTNDKIRVLETSLGQSIMMKTLTTAKQKFHFILTNFNIMPTHFHLLIQPTEEFNLSLIMGWIKTNSAKRWNFLNGSIDHLWGDRYFSKPIKSAREYEHIMNYIDQNPVVAGLADTPSDWIFSGAYHRTNNIIGLVDGDSHLSTFRYTSSAE